jgi:hypothetical protein
LLAEAGFFLLLARAELAVLPFARIMSGLGGRSESERPGSARASGRGARQQRNHLFSRVWRPDLRVSLGDAAEWIRQIRWAVKTMARHSPLPLICLPQALAAMWMLQSRGFAPRLLYGVRTDRTNGFSAHAWVELDGAPVVGHRVAAGFTVLAGFPALSGSGIS